MGDHLSQYNLIKALVEQLRSYLLRRSPIDDSLCVGKQNTCQQVWLTYLQLCLQSRAKLQDLHNFAKTVACNIGTVQNFARFARSCKIFCLQNLHDVANFGKISVLANLHKLGKIWRKFARNCQGFCLPTRSVWLK